MTTARPGMAQPCLYAAPLFLPPAAFAGFRPAGALQGVTFDRSEADEIAVGATGVIAEIRLLGAVAFRRPETPVFMPGHIQFGEGGIAPVHYAGAGASAASPERSSTREDRAGSRPPPGPQPRGQAHARGASISRCHRGRSRDRSRRGRAGVAAPDLPAKDG